MVLKPKPTIPMPQPRPQPMVRRLTPELLIQMHLPMLQL
jgi:hypothetical protein